MTTLAEWEAELHRLRSEFSPTRPMLVRWFAVREPFSHRSLAWLAWDRLRGKELKVLRWEVAFYPVTATSGASPTVMVDVRDETPWPTAQPTQVDVAGRLEAGAAIAFRLPGGEVIFGCSQARPAPLLRRRRL